MYKIMNFLFGYDYIQWENCADQGVARVFKLSSGKIVYWRYKSTSTMDEIKNSNQVNWLTCHPSKFGL